MEEKLKRLFEYQKFEQNRRIARLIGETEARQIAELSDDDLKFVAAAGDASDIKDEIAKEPGDGKDMGTWRTMDDN